MPLEKAHLCSTKDALKALSKLAPSVNKLPYYIGHKLAALTSFTKLARQLLSKHTEAEMRGVLNTPALSHAGQHQHGGIDEVATATPGANAIPKAGSGGELDKNWLPVFTGDTGAGGAKGAVLAPSAGDADKGWVLRADGTWGPATVASYYFYTNTNSDLGAYKEMQRGVPAGVEATFARTITSASGEVLLVAFATPLGEPGVTVLSSGIWTFKCYATVSNAAGTTNLILRVYKRTAGGVETQLFYAMSGDIDTTLVTLAEVDKVVTDQTLALTDRIIIKVYALTTSGTEKTVTLYVEGSTNVSCVQTPLVGASISDFSDGVLKIHSAVDSTKILRFSATPIDTATTRVLTPLNKSYILEETGHASKHKHGGGDEVSTATPGANAIPKADASNKLDNGWLNTGHGNGIDVDTTDTFHASATPTIDTIVVAEHAAAKISNSWLKTGSGNGIDADTVDAAHASATPTIDTIVVADHAAAKINNGWLNTGHGNSLDADTTDTFHASATPTIDTIVVAEHAAAKISNSWLKTGSGNGLDADTTDTFHASATPTIDTIVVADHAAAKINNSWLNTGSGNGLDADTTDTFHASATPTIDTIVVAEHASAKISNSWLKTGSGNGIDADTTDTFHASATPTIDTIVVAEHASAKISNSWLKTGSGNGIDADTVDTFHASATPTIDTIVVADHAAAKINNSWLNTGTGNGLDADTVDAAHASATPTASYIPIADVSNKLHILWLPTQAALYQFSPADKMFAPESGWTENTAAAWLDGTTAPYVKFDGTSKTATQLDIIEIPAGVTNINFRFLGQKDDVADVGTIVWLGFRFKTWPSGAAISAESAVQTLGNWTVGASNTNCLYKIYTATIASFGLAVNNVVSINLLRDPTNASDDVTCGMNIRKLWIYFS